MVSFQQIPYQFDIVSIGIGAIGTLVGSLCLLVYFTGKLRKKLVVSEMMGKQRKDETVQLNQEIERLRRQRDDFRNECEILGRQTAVLQTRFADMEEQVNERETLLETVQKELTFRFELLAGEILSEKSSLVKQQHETALQNLLQPFHNQLRDFRQKVDDVYDKETRDRTAISSEIKHLRSLNERLSRDATNLTEALQGKNKLQGQWGEMILDTLLEQSGLKKGKEFTAQKSFLTESGKRQQPDVIIHLPEKRDIIIDAKVSLKAFVKAHGEEDSSRRRKYIGMHLDSVKQHVNGLAKKQYYQLEGLNSLDFVLLFIPVEAAFHMVVENEPEFLHRTMQKNVILCSPATLLPILRTIHHLWRQDEQNRNGLIIAKHAGNLYDKFVGFIETFEEIGTRLNQSHKAWQLARNRLTNGKGNLVQRVDQLKELGVQSEKKLADVLKHSSKSKEIK